MQSLNEKTFLNLKIVSENCVTNQIFRLALICMYSRKILSTLILNFFHCNLFIFGGIVMVFKTKYVQQFTVVYNYRLIFCKTIISFISHKWRKKLKIWT